MGAEERALADALGLGIENLAINLGEEEVGIIDREDEWSFFQPCVLSVRKTAKFLFALRAISQFTALTVLINNPRCRAETLIWGIVQEEIFKEIFVLHRGNTSINLNP